MNWLLGFFLVVAVLYLAFAAGVLVHWAREIYITSIARKLARGVLVDLAFIEELRESDEEALTAHMKRLLRSPDQQKALRDFAVVLSATHLLRYEFQVARTVFELERLQLEPDALRYLEASKRRIVSPELVGQYPTMGRMSRRKLGYLAERLTQNLVQILRRCSPERV